MKVRTVFVVLFIAFGAAVLGAAITTTKLIEMKQAAKAQSLTVRRAG